MFNQILDLIEYFIRMLVELFVKCLRVKIIRDDKGTPFLYRYHLFNCGNNGPGICIHHFVKSDPDRGFHDHPWRRAFSFILCGSYSERIINLHGKKGKEIHNTTFDSLDFDTFERQRWRFNCLKGRNSFHRVMLKPEQDAWTIFFFSGRSKRWAFPGGRIEKSDKNMKEAAIRELQEETNIHAYESELKYVKSFGNNTRDPRGFTVANIYLLELDEKPFDVKAGDDAVNFEWYNIDNLPQLAFDHKNIIDELTTIAE